MLYIDFDGVILDTEPLLFEEWRKNPNRHSLPESEKIKYLQKCNWNYIINNSPVINDSLYYLRQMDPSISCILTKVHSLENESVEKIKWLRENGIKQSVVIVPYYFKKSEVAIARGNILIDDCLKNLSEWEELGGIPIFFDMNNDDYDSWHQKNVKQYKKVLTLSTYKDYIGGQND